jgi:hypothetical protein
MTQKFNIILRRRASYFGIESTYDQTPSMTRVFPMNDYTIATEQENVDNNDERVFRHDYIAPMQGLLSATADPMFYVKPNLIQSDHLATPAIDYLGMILKTVLGGEVLTAGSTMAGSAGTASVINVGSGDGAKFLAGTLLAVPTTGSTLLEPSMVASRATDALTIWPIASSSPSSAVDAIAMRQYYPTEANSGSFTWQAALADDSAYEWTLNGGIAELEFKFERGKPITMSTKMEFATWAGPTAQSLSAATAADTLLHAFVMRNAKFYLQSATPATATHYPLYSAAIKISKMVARVPELGGTAEGTIGIHAIAEPRFACEITLTGPHDTTRKTQYDAQTQQALMMIMPYGTGLTQRGIVFAAPGCVQTKVPQTVAGPDGTAATQMVWRAQLNAVTGSTATELARAPFSIATY